jgi:hypothetical protein
MAVGGRRLAYRQLYWIRDVRCTSSLHFAGKSYSHDVKCIPRKACSNFHASSAQRQAGSRIFHTKLLNVCFQYEFSNDFFKQPASITVVFIVGPVQKKVDLQDFQSGGLTFGTYKPRKRNWVKIMETNNYIPFVRL